MLKKTGDGRHARLLKEVVAYHHPPVDREVQEPDPRPGRYYVSARDGGKHAYLLGPFPTHPEALAQVDRAWAKALEMYPREATWCGFGTCRLRDDWCGPAPWGILNEVLNYKPEVSNGASNARE